MLEYMHCDPKAFNREWKRWPWYRYNQLRFDLFTYRIWDVEYNSDTPEFRKALEALKIIDKLSK